MKPTFRWYYVFPAIPLYMVALLPSFLFYGFIDVLRALVFYVIRYRRGVVETNLRNSFPDKDEAWIQKISWKFYQNLLDTFFETIRMAVLPLNAYPKHVKYDLGVVEDLKRRQQPFILVCGHLANYEWAGQTVQYSGTQVDVLYHPLTSPFFEWFIYHCRSRHGLLPVPMQRALREMTARKHIPAVTTFIADQTPGPEGCHWMTFLNQDTPVFMGVEKLARKFNYPVVYGEIDRLGRGKYYMWFQLLFEKPAETKPFEITETHMRWLEKRIHEQPEDWLWSHRRWKHKRPTE